MKTANNICLPRICRRMSGLHRSVVVVVVVAAVMAGSLARANPKIRQLKALADMIKMEEELAEERSTHWGVNMTTVGESGRKGGKREGCHIKS